MLELTNQNVSEAVAKFRNVQFVLFWLCLQCSLSGHVCAADSTDSPPPLLLLPLTLSVYLSLPLLSSLLVTVTLPSFLSVYAFHCCYSEYVGCEVRMEAGG